MTTAFIATTGGHLTQLVDLAERIPPDPDAVWVTHANEQSTSLLAGRDVQYIPYVGVRDIPGVLRCVLRAHALYRQPAPDTRGVDRLRHRAGLPALPRRPRRRVPLHRERGAGRRPVADGPDPALGPARPHLHAVPALERRALALRRQRLRRATSRWPRTPRSATGSAWWSPSARRRSSRSPG